MRREKLNFTQALRDGIFGDESTPIYHRLVMLRDFCIYGDFLGPGKWVHHTRQMSRPDVLRKRRRVTTRRRHALPADVLFRLMDEPDYGEGIDERDLWDRLLGREIRERIFAKDSTFFELLAEVVDLDFVGYNDWPRQKPDPATAAAADYLLRKIFDQYRRNEGSLIDKSGTKESITATRKEIRENVLSKIKRPEMGEEDVFDRLKKIGVRFIRDDRRSPEAVKWAKICRTLDSNRNYRGPELSKIALSKKIDLSERQLRRIAKQEGVRIRQAGRPKTEK